MATQEEILKITIDNEAAQKNLEDQTKKIEDLKKENQELLKTNKKLAKSEEDTTQQRKENSAEIVKNKAQITQLNASNRKSVKALNAVDKSYGAMKIRLADVTTAIDKVDLSTEKGIQSVKRLREEQAKLNNALKKGEAEGSSFTRNVGNYANGIKDATSSILPFNAALLASPIGLTAGALGALVTVGRSVFSFFPINNHFTFIRVLISSYKNTFCIYLSNICVIFYLQNYKFKIF